MPSKYFLPSFNFTKKQKSCSQNKKKKMNPSLRKRRVFEDESIVDERVKQKFVHLFTQIIFISTNLLFFFENDKKKTGREEEESFVHYRSSWRKENRRWK